MEVHHVYSPNCSGGEGQHWHYPSREIRIRAQKNGCEKRVTADWMRPCGLRLWSASIADLGMHWKHMLLRPGLGRCLQENLPRQMEVIGKKKKKKKRQSRKIWCQPWTLTLTLNVSLPKWGKVLMSQKKWVGGKKKKEEEEEEEKKPFQSH